MKTIQAQELYVLVDVNGDMIGLDANSGGYPWVPSYLSGVKFFNSLQEAENYKKIGFEMFEIKKFEYAVKSLPTNKMRNIEDAAEILRRFRDEADPNEQLGDWLARNSIVHFNKNRPF